MVIKNISSVLRLRETPVGVPIEAMMTMATSTVDCTTPWCPCTQTTLSNPSSTSPASIVSKSDACNTNQPSSTNLMGLRENPTRISRQDSLDAVVDTFDNGDDDRNTHKTATSPTTLAGSVAPLPYQSKLAAITAAIERLKKNDEANHMHLESGISAFTPNL